MDAVVIFPFTAKVINVVAGGFDRIKLPFMSTNDSSLKVYFMRRFNSKAVYQKMCVFHKNVCFS